MEGMSCIEKHVVRMEGIAKTKVCLLTKTWRNFEKLWDLTTKQKNNITAGNFSRIFLESVYQPCVIQNPRFFSSNWTFRGVVLDGFWSLFEDFLAKKAARKPIHFNIIPKSILDDFMFDFDAFLGHFLVDFSNYAKSLFSMTIPCEMAVSRGRRVRKKSLKSKRFPSRVSEPPFRRKWGSEVSPRGLLNSKLAVPGMEKGGKKQ